MEAAGPARLAALAGMPLTCLASAMKSQANIAGHIVLTLHPGCKGPVVLLCAARAHRQCRTIARQSMTSPCAVHSRHRQSVHAVLQVHACHCTLCIFLLWHPRRLPRC